MTRCGPHHQGFGSREAVAGMRLLSPATVSRALARYSVMNG
ncbi:MAG TPA: hypothetical protein VMH47_08095 [Gaiellaceae bacterium]|nr:hypothetical protein [Gaiellaceae bacterium]